MSDEREEELRHAYRRAVTALPSVTRDILLAHRVDGDDMAVIADRHRMTAADVARHLADALIAIDRALRAVGR